MSESEMGLKLAIKFLVTAVLLWLVFRKVDLGAVSQLISGLDPWWAAAAILMTGLIVLFDATMLVEVMRIFARRMQFGTALLYSIVGWFFSNVAPSTVGGDVFRGLQFSRVGVPIGTAIRIILSIRVLSFVTLVLVIAAGFPIALGLLKQTARRASARNRARGRGRCGPASRPARFRSAADREARPVAAVRQADDHCRRLPNAPHPERQVRFNMACRSRSAPPSRWRAGSARGGARARNSPSRLCSRSRPPPC